MVACGHPTVPLGAPATAPTVHPMPTAPALPEHPPDQASRLAFPIVVAVWLGAARLVVTEPDPSGGEPGRTDVTHIAAHLIAAGLRLGASGPAAAPTQTGAVAADGRVTVATAALEDAERCVIAVRWADDEVEVLDHHAAVLAASRAISDALDPPGPLTAGGGPHIPFGA